MFKKLQSVTKDACGFFRSKHAISFFKGFRVLGPASTKWPLYLEVPSGLGNGYLGRFGFSNKWDRVGWGRISCLAMRFCFLTTFGACV